MRSLIALLLPWLLFFTVGRPIAGLICLVVCATIIHWIPASIWAVYALNRHETAEKMAG